MKQRTILDEAQISRSLTRMAHEVLERNKGTENIILLGIKTRGEFLADRLQDKISQIESVNVPTGTIDISNYRDDKAGQTLNDEDIVIDTDLNDKHVVLVDDVLFTGRTIRAAMDAILNSVRPSKISLAVLIDRGHRELPIRADYVGKNIPTAKGEIINVALMEVDNENAVTLTE
ncbi:bifunctional pyr operon transcriptional regulator/uracil phosphoribosyltransferase PyrR [Salinicoccus sp. Marseille-QA3877]